MDSSDSSRLRQMKEEIDALGHTVARIATSVERSRIQTLHQSDEKDRSTVQTSSGELSSFRRKVTNPDPENRMRKSKRLASKRGIWQQR